VIRAFDSHCHLQDDAFSDDRDQVYREAHQLGLGFIIPGYSRASSEAAVRLAGVLDDAYALVGIHPHDAAAFEPQDEQLLEQWSHDPRVVGIGEIGLDYHYDLSPRPVQRAVFLRQLQLAHAWSLPVAIHTREAEEETLELITEAKTTRAVLHCFTGTEAFAQALLERGFYLSFSGVVTFANAGALRGVVRNVPLERLLIETDSPYLAPVPFRGRRNQPAWVVNVAKVIATEKNCSVEEVFSHTMANTLKVFSLNADNL
jgi:TatD DNase family protein